MQDRLHLITEHETTDPKTGRITDLLVLRETETTGMTEIMALVVAETETAVSAKAIGTARAADSERILQQADLLREPAVKENLITETVRAVSSQAGMISLAVNSTIRAAQEVAPSMRLQQKRGEATETKKDAVWVRKRIRETGKILLMSRKR